MKAERGSFLRHRFQMPGSEVRSISEDMSRMPIRITEKSAFSGGYWTSTGQFLDYPYAIGYNGNLTWVGVEDIMGEGLRPVMWVTP